MAAKQALLRFQLGETKYPLYATDFKDMLARELGGDPVSGEALFHYKNGQPMNGEPDVRFVGGRQWVGILSLSGDVDKLVGQVATCSRLLHTRLGHAVSVRIEEPEFSAEVSQYPIQYYFREVAIKSANRWPGAHEDLIMNRLTRTLIAKRDEFGFDLPGAAPQAGQTRGQAMKADAKALAERLGIRIEDGRRLAMRLEVASGMTNQYVELSSGTFTMYCKLSGIWQMGNLQARGYGRIIPAAHQTQTQARGEN